MPTNRMQTSPQRKPGPAFMKLLMVVATPARLIVISSAAERRD
jgi:hypothetical protein